MNRYLKFLCLCSILLGESTQASLSVTSPLTLNALPSASAQLWIRDRLYVVGDDSPYLFTLNSDFSPQLKQLVFETSEVRDGRIKSKFKPDLEAMDMFTISGQNHLIALGSGTQPNLREKAMLLSIDDNNVEWRDIGPLYRHLHTIAKLTKTQKINIEGLAHDSSHVYLFNRGSHGPNLIFSFSYQEFIAYLVGDSTAIPSVNVQTVLLPKLDGHLATLSGADYDPTSRNMFITASVDAHREGILGSFVIAVPIGKLSTSNKLDLTSAAYLVTVNGQVLNSKIESIAIQSSKNGQVGGFLAADNDDGTSQFAQFSLILPNES
ncbi:DUF6929 family protein [Microbulbifer sp. DLAB2-AF]|uniref:DUF6929 family protein n=1 Tax=unclassified Microbulbifer TaxID=2619833 RepID=UPI004039EB25